MKTKLPARGLRKILLIAAIAAIALSVNLPNLRAQAPAAGGAPAPPATAANMKGKTAGEFYQNVTVLKDIPAASLHNAMEYITVALGVPCAYCHVGGRFESEDKREKHVARNMIKMTMALNATVFDGKREVTCYTCHRGAPIAAPTPVFPGETSPTEPTAAEIFPPLAVQGITNLDPSMSPRRAPTTVAPGAPTAQKPAAAPAPLPTAADVFSKYTQALGGMAAIGKVTSLVEKGTVDMLVPGAPGTPAAIGTVPAEIDRKIPGKAVVSVQFPGRAPNLEGFDGTISYIGAREEAGSELDMRKEFAEFPPALNFQKEHSNVQVDARENVGGRDAYRVVGTRLDGSALDRLDFDTQTGLLLRSYTTMQSVLGSFPEELDYQDYRAVSGIQVPFTMLFVSPQGNRTYKWATVDANVTLEDSRFAKPGAPPPPPAARPAGN